MTIYNLPVYLNIQSRSCKIVDT